MGGKTIRRFRRLLVLPALLLFASCSDRALSLFFDIPPPTQEEIEAAAAEKAAAEATAAQAATGGGTVAPAVAEIERPAIEQVTSWDQAAEMLPKDAAEEVDWMAALREGTIKPRAATDGPGNPQAAVFKWDFFFPGPDPSLNAYFPHSSHTEWLACESCHPAIFPMRELEVTMDQVFEGEYCGVCHGKVAFPLETCSRCHLDME